ncbi:alpha/beta hydrolase [Glaesserella sp.]|uniref:alpha/beta hydrolase n=1 Tax=Glaesserella sp. TaxID=2094731 RepID=UPI0035A196FA
MFRSFKKLVCLALISLAPFAQAGEKMIKNVVLVHGAFVDGSSYRAVIQSLQAKGYQVTAVQNPLTSLDDDVAAVKQVLDRQDGDVVLVGHSWGGVVISEAGNHEKVKRLVYLSAIVPNNNESAGQALSRHRQATSKNLNKEPNTKSDKDLQPDEKGMIWLPSAEVYQAVMANDLPLQEVQGLFATQTPISAKAFGQAVTEPAWKTKPSYYLLAKQDNALPFKAQQSFAAMINAQTKTISGSHLSIISQPQATVELIELAAK